MISTRVRALVRQQWVGLIALFIALGGTAYAAATVGSEEVIDNSLRSVDLKDNAGVKSVDVVDDTATGGGLTSADIRNNNLRGADILNGSLTGADIASNSVSEGKIADGAVTPAKLGTVPAVRATGYCTQNLIANNTEQSVMFMNDDFDTASMHPTGGFGSECNSGTSTLTAPRSGIYDVSGGAFWTANSTGMRQLSLRKNGTDYLASQTTPGLGNTPQEVSTIVTLAQGDYVELVAFQNSGGYLYANYPSPADPRSYVAMAWVGPG